MDHKVVVTEQGISDGLLRARIARTLGHLAMFMSRESFDRVIDEAAHAQSGNANERDGERHA